MGRCTSNNTEDGTIPCHTGLVRQGQTAFLNDVHEIPQELFRVMTCCENKRENQKENDHDHDHDHGGGGGGGGPENNGSCIFRNLFLPYTRYMQGPFCQMV